MFKINNRNTRARCKICSKLTTNTIEGFLFKTLSTQMPTRYYTPLKSGTTEHVHDNILRLRGHGNKFHATATIFFCWNRTKLCFHVRMAKLMQQILMKQNQLRFLKSYFTRWQP